MAPSGLAEARGVLVFDIARPDEFDAWLGQPLDRPSQTKSWAKIIQAQARQVPIGRPGIFFIFYFLFR